MSSESPVRLILGGGHSPIPTWPLATLAGGSYLQVGSGPACQWRVQGPGVGLAHLVLYWDSQTLWAADPEGAGVFLDERQISEWVPVRPGETLRFGAASLTLQGNEESGEIPPPTGSPSESADTNKNLVAHEQAVTDDYRAGAGSAGSAATHIFRSQSDGKSESKPIFGGAAKSATQILSADEYRAEGMSVPKPRIARKKTEEPAPPNPGTDEPAEPRSSGGPVSSATASSVAAGPTEAPQAAGSSVPDGIPADLDKKFALPPPEPGKTKPSTVLLSSAKKFVFAGRARWAVLGGVGLFCAMVMIAAVSSGTPDATPARGQGQAGAASGSEERAPWARERTALPPAPSDLPVLDRPAEARGGQRPRDVEEPRRPEPSTRPQTRRSNSREPTLERRAADALKRRDVDEAVTLYTELARKHPDNTAYTNILAILEESETNEPVSHGTSVELREQHIDRRIEQQQKQRRDRRRRR